MIDNSEIYKNPIVPSDFYFMKVISVQDEEANYIFPKLLVRLKLHPGYEFPEDYVFSSILHPTQMSYFHYKNFFNAYMLGEKLDAFDKAIGRWGSIKLEQKKYGETQYSAVKFVYQPLPVRMESWKIGAENKQE